MTEAEDGRGKRTEEKKCREKYKYRIVFYTAIFLSLCNKRKAGDTLKMRLICQGLELPSDI
jgi:hypothetical protein